ncbi:multicopper oxidase family protein [Deinococcus cellulosilyticus]|uniref:Oxidoreductase n=2 Tax=Deinococcus cellulosilyticus TaxID=401558 RepID=A0A511N2K8_DEIC1
MIRTLTSLTLLTVALTACAPKGSPMTEYHNPAEVQASRTEKGSTFTLTAAETSITLDGKEVKAQLFNQSFPGPQLTLQAGEQVNLTLKNDLREPTNLHLHGLTLPAGVDDPFLQVQPGESHTYSFTVPQGLHGTFWYHTHTHGHLGTQLFQGLAGPLIVEDPTFDSHIQGMETHTVVLKDLPVEVQDSDGTRMNGREGKLLVNGLSSPTLKTESSWVRLRLINASNARYDLLKLSGSAFLHVIAKDGIDLPKTEQVKELLLTPGERADVLISVQDQQDLRLENHPYDRGVHEMDGGHQGHTPSTPEVLLTLQGKKGSVSASVPQPALQPRPFLKVTGNEAIRKVVLQETMQPVKFFINGRTFDMNRVDFHVSEGTTEIWEVENQTEMDHPFHLHTFPVQVLSVNGQEVPPVWKDTVNVPAKAKVQVAVKFEGFTGKTVFHCHIAEHEEEGMMGVLQVHPAGEALPASLTPTLPPAAASEDMPDMPGMDHSGH